MEGGQPVVVIGWWVAGLGVAAAAGAMAVGVGVGGGEVVVEGEGRVGRVVGGGRGVVGGVTERRVLRVVLGGWWGRVGGGQDGGGGGGVVREGRLWLSVAQLQLAMRRRRHAVHDEEGGGREGGRKRESKQMTTLEVNAAFRGDSSQSSTRCVNSVGHRTRWRWERSSEVVHKRTALSWRSSAEHVAGVLH